MRQQHSVPQGPPNRWPGFRGLIGISPKMQAVYKLVERASEHACAVLILGESGTGKELVARSIHFSEPRGEGPFVPVDCSALVPTLIESELFGFVRGAFTGATYTKLGLMALADQGTLFLDEIGELPTHLQSKLLRALQEKEIKPVGSSSRVPINVRVIAATNHDLQSAVRNGTFRQDLYFRLNVVEIKLPPLRERKSDIPLLVHYFLEKLQKPHNNGRPLSDDALRQLMVYDWPGNVRELENAMESAMALSFGPALELNDFPTAIKEASPELSLFRQDPLDLEEMKRRAIVQALNRTAGDKIAAARLLGVSKTTLYRWLQREGPQRPAFLSSGKKAEE